MTIKVYSTEQCVKCFVTKKSFARKGIEVEEIMLDDESLEYVKSLGHDRAPVVVVEQDGQVIDHWSDFRETKIAALQEVAVA